MLFVTVKIVSLLFTLFVVQKTFYTSYFYYNRFLLDERYHTRLLAGKLYLDNDSRVNAPTKFVTNVTSVADKCLLEIENRPELPNINETWIKISQDTSRTPLRKSKTNDNNETVKLIRMMLKKSTLTQTMEVKTSTPGIKWIMNDENDVHLEMISKKKTSAPRVKQKTQFAAMTVYKFFKNFDLFEKILSNLLEIGLYIIDVILRGTRLGKLDDAFINEVLLNCGYGLYNVEEVLESLATSDMLEILACWFEKEIKTRWMLLSTVRVLFITMICIWNIITLHNFGLEIKGMNDRFSTLKEENTFDNHLRPNDESGDTKPNVEQRYGTRKLKRICELDAVSSKQN